MVKDKKKMINEHDSDYMPDSYGSESSAVLVLKNYTFDLVNVLRDFPNNIDTSRFTYVKIRTTDFSYTNYSEDSGDYWTPPTDDYEVGDWGGNFEIADIDSELDDEANEDNAEFMEKLQAVISDHFEEVENVLRDNAELLKESKRSEKSLIKESDEKIEVDKTFNPSYLLAKGFPIQKIHITYYPEDDYATGDIMICGGERDNCLSTSFGIDPLKGHFNAYMSDPIPNWRMSTEEKQAFHDFILKCVEASGRNIVKESIEEGKVVGPLDEHAVREMLLWFENTEKLWHVGEHLAETLSKKVMKGENISFERLVKSSVMDAIVRATINDYAKKFGQFQVSTETRDAIKQEISKSIINIMDVNEENHPINEGTRNEWTSDDSVSWDDIQNYMMHSADYTEKNRIRSDKLGVPQEERCAFCEKPLKGHYHELYMRKPTPEEYEKYGSSSIYSTVDSPGSQKIKVGDSCFKHVTKAMLNKRK